MRRRGVGAGLRGSALVLALALPLLLAACGGSGGPSDPAGSSGTGDGGSSSGPTLSEPSGVSGRTVVAPTCPVEQTASPCPPRPIQAGIEVRAAGSSAVLAHTVSGEAGYFRLVLPPGTYLLTAKTNPPALMPRPKEVRVTVSAHEFTQVTITLDSGIRAPGGSPPR